MPVNLLGLNREALTQVLEELGEKPFRARQLMKWIHQFGESDFNQMTDIAKSFREKLASIATVQVPRLLSEQVSQDGTRKWLLELSPGNAIETVFIPEDERGTLCISSQVGCALACTFCSTGTNDGVNLINKKNNFSIRSFNFFHDSFKPFFKLSAVFRPSYE